MRKPFFNKLRTHKFIGIGDAFNRQLPASRKPSEEAITKPVPLGSGCVETDAADTKPIVGGIAGQRDRGNVNSGDRVGPVHALQAGAMEAPVEDCFDFPPLVQVR
jgi:hypothetical protein